MNCIVSVYANCYVISMRLFLLLLFSSVCLMSILERDEEMLMYGARDSWYTPHGRNEMNEDEQRFNCHLNRNQQRFDRDYVDFEHIQVYVALNVCFCCQTVSMNQNN